MKLPGTLRIHVLADGRALAGMFVAMDIKTNWRSDFNLSFGPTNEQGELVVTHDDMMKKAQELRDFFAMDYGDLDQDFSGEIIVSARNRESLGLAIEAYHSFQHVVPFPPRYAEQVQEARMVLEELERKVLSVKVEHDGEGVVVRVETVSA